MNQAASRAAFSERSVQSAGVGAATASLSARTLRASDPRMLRARLSVALLRADPAIRRRIHVATARSIEIEAKFPFSEVDKRRIASRGQLRGSKIFTDTYWDHLRHYPLTTRDMWLRRREEVWELKVPVSTWQGKEAGGPSAIDHYKEFGSEPEILSFLANQSLLATASQLTTL